MIGGRGPEEGYGVEEKERREEIEEEVEKEIFIKGE
jgi:hypothetical protein